MSTECPFKLNHSQNWLNKLMIKSDDGKCPARQCPVLKDYINKPANNSYSGKCPFLLKHPCSYFEKMIQKNN